MHLPHARVSYSIRLLPSAYKRFWLSGFTPVWHEGRGPYISIGLYFFGLYRGY